MPQETWDEIQKAADDQRHELHLTGDVITERLKSRDMKLPNELFSLNSLNYLEISDTELDSIPPEIGRLGNMINLALHRNCIGSVPDTLTELKKLKFLDISFNKLKKLPENLNLSSVHTLILSNNQLEQMSDLSSAKSLSILRIDHNALLSLPTGLNSLPNLSEIYAASNVITELPTDLNKIVFLKVLDVSNNKLKSVPDTLADCQKMKTLKLEGNPLSDNRLRKMTNQCATKAILEYIAKQSSASSGGKKGKNKKKGGKGGSENTTNNDDGNEEDDDVRKIIVVANTQEDMRVILDGSIKNLRPFICCTVIKNLDLRDATIFKDFLSLQTKLHENECDMRTRATIATHDMSQLKFPLKYKASSTQHTRIHALGKQKECTAASLIENLKAERDALKLKKKRQPKTGLYKFIDLVDGKESIASLRNSDDVVVSLPPITNGEDSKITSSVSDVFVEITSPVSLAQCKYVIEEMIKKMVQQNFISKVDDAKHNCLVIQPIRVVDENEDLKVVYPSKIDLDFHGIKVERITS